jgi:drug/metabolite transporter (DMT)-like permease
VDGTPFALGSSLFGGTADFLGGTNSRRIGTLAWMFCTQLIGVFLAGGLVAVTRDRLPPLASLAEAAGAGFSLTICLLAFFEAMVVGRMSIVAPISATGVAIPIAAGVVQGERPGALQIAGMVAALIGIVLASRVPREDARAGIEEGLGLALVAAAGGGVFFWLMAPASRHGGVAWATLMARVVPVLLLAVAVRLRQTPVRSALALPHIVAWMLVSSVIGISAVILYGLATVHGGLAVVSVLSSLYPVVTVLLAYRLLGERVHRDQGIGILAVVAGVILLSAG